MRERGIFINVNNRRYDVIKFLAACEKISAVF